MNRPDPHAAANQAPVAGAGAPASQAGLALPVGWEVAKVDPRQSKAALSLLLTGRVRGGDATVEQFTQFAQNHSMNLDRFWTASIEGELVAAALIVGAAGRAGMVFLSPLIRDSHVHGAAALLAHACQKGHVQDLALLQTLLDPHQQREKIALEEAGFYQLAKLLYMRRRTQRGLAVDDLPDGLERVTWQESHRSLFADAILQSYQDTLDCPGLVGMRDIDDIIAGHMSAGQFDPSLWQVIHHKGKPAGVMLLSPLASRDAMELVYLGLSPAWRGKGLAQLLMQQALQQAYTYGSTEMLLAVDENNAPALKLYQGLKFTPTARKLAMLRKVE